MPKVKKAVPNTPPARTPTPPPTRRTDAALRPATPLEAIVSRALDQELEWYFAHAEAALHRADVGMLPSYAAVRVLATEPTDEACSRHALGLALAVRMCLVRLAGPNASVLRVAYSPRRWPNRVEETWGPLSGIVVRLWFVIDPWPPRWGRSGLEEAAATQLAAALAEKGHVPIGRLRQRADRLLRSAVIAGEPDEGVRGTHEPRRTDSWWIASSSGSSTARSATWECVRTSCPP